MLSLIIAFIILVGDKTNMRYKLRDKCDIWRMPIIAKLLDCDFCLSFWLAVIAIIILLVMFKEPILILVPFISTPLARFWL